MGDRGLKNIGFLDMRRKLKVNRKMDHEAILFSIVFYSGRLRWGCSIGSGLATAPLAVPTSVFG